MNDREKLVKKAIILSISLLLIAFFAPVITVFLGGSIAIENKGIYFQSSCAIGAVCSYLSQVNQSKAFTLLCPKSSFEPPGCFELRQKYLKLVLILGSIWKWLAVVTILLGVLGSYISKELIIHGWY